MKMSQLPWCFFLVLLLAHCSRSLRNLNSPAYQLELVHLSSNVFSSREHLLNVLKQDSLRVHAIQSSLQSSEHAKVGAAEDPDSPTLPLSSAISLGAGEYVVKLGIGTPPLPVYLVMDTGSDITWLQCSPCISCYPQANPIFSPQNSSSYEAISCNSSVCNSTCEDSETDSCPYHVEYLDRSSSSGVLSKEIFTFTDGASMKNKILFGCGHNNVGLFSGYSGLVGFGGGPSSFISQLPQELGSSFSYCMVDRNSPLEVSSPLVLGSRQNFASSTPLLYHPRSTTYQKLSSSECER